MTATLYSPSDVDAANDAWSANCGPIALAAMLGVPVADVRRGFPAYPAKPWCTPTTMLEALRLLGHKAMSVTRSPGDITLVDGLAYVQWTGPWTAPGASPRWAYRHTHWVALAHHGFMIYDANVGDWRSRAYWTSRVVPFLLEDIPRADGGWWVRTTIEVTP